MDRSNLFSAPDNTASIQQLRNIINPNASSKLSDLDCLRFLRARPDSISQAGNMINAWYEWRSTLLDPLPPDNLRFSPNIILANPHILPEHPYVHLLPG